MPVYVTELDITGDPASEANQLKSYENIFPVFWEHPAVAGITLWGYVEGSTWREGTGIINRNGSKRSALEWLEQYMEGLPDVGYPFQGIEIEGDGNMITNGQFDMGTTAWDLQINAGAAATLEAVTGAGMSGPKAIRICPENAGTENWHIQLRQLVPISNGKKYSISFLAKADQNRTIDVAIQHDADPYTTHFEEHVTLTDEVQTFEFEFTSTENDALATLKFYAGNDAACVDIDNVEMYEIPDSSSNAYELTKQKSFSVYPNPFNNNITISSKTGFDRAQYHLMNVSGRIVQQGVFNRQHTIETAGLDNGFYILRIESGLQTESIKLIKK